MSTSAQIRSAWNSGVWTNGTVTALTTKIYAYDLVASLKSKPEAVSMYYNQSINFFTYLVNRTRVTQEIRGANTSVQRYEYDVTVNYYLQKDLTDSAQNYNNVIDRLETVDGIVISGLGATWSSTVNYYEMSGILTPTLIELDDREVWRGGYQYRAIKQA